MTTAVDVEPAPSLPDAMHVGGEGGETGVMARKGVGLQRILALNNKAVVKGGVVVGRKSSVLLSSPKAQGQETTDVVKAAHELRRLEKEAAVLAKPPDDRTADDIDFILSILMRAKAKILMDLPPEKQMMLAQKVTLNEPMKEGDMLWNEGDKGDSYIVVLSGVVSILKWDQVRAENAVVATLKKGAGFGEIALQSPDSKRAAGVLCETDCTFVRVTAGDYSSVLDGEGAAKISERVSYLKGLALFKDMPLANLTSLALVLRERSVPHNTVIVREGADAEDFYFIVRGNVRVIKCIKCTVDEELVVPPSRASTRSTVPGPLSSPWELMEAENQQLSPRGGPGAGMGLSGRGPVVRLPGIGETRGTDASGGSASPRTDRSRVSRRHLNLVPRPPASSDPLPPASGGSPRARGRSSGGSASRLKSNSFTAGRAASMAHRRGEGGGSREEMEMGADAVSTPSPRAQRSLRGRSMDLMPPSRRSEVNRLATRSFDMAEELLDSDDGLSSSPSSQPWRVKKEKAVPRKRLVEVATLTQGASFGEVGLLRTGRYGSSVISLGQCTLLSVGKFDVHRRLSPHILQQLWNQSSKSVSLNTDVEAQLEDSLKWEKYKNGVVQEVLDIKLRKVY